MSQQTAIKPQIEQYSREAPLRYVGHDEAAIAAREDLFDRAQNLYELEVVNPTNVFMRAQMMHESVWHLPISDSAKKTGLARCLADYQSLLQSDESLPKADRYIDHNVLLQRQVGDVFRTIRTAQFKAGGKTESSAAGLIKSYLADVDMFRRGASLKQGDRFEQYVHALCSTRAAAAVIEGDFDSEWLEPDAFRFATSHEDATIGPAVNQNFDLLIHGQPYQLKWGKRSDRVPHPSVALIETPFMETGHEGDKFFNGMANTMTALLNGRQLFPDQQSMLDDQFEWLERVV